MSDNEQTIVIRNQSIVIRNLRGKLDIREAENKALLEKAADDKKTIDWFVNAYHRLVDERNAANNRVRQVTKEYDFVKEELAKTRSQLAETIEEHTSKPGVLALEEQHAAQIRTIQNLIDENKKFFADLKKASWDNRQFEIEIEFLTAECDERQRKIDQVSEELATAIKERDGFESEVYCIEKDRDVILAQSNRLRRQLDAARQALRWISDNPEAADRRPHSRACGIQIHEHGSACHVNCPTCYP